MGTGHLNIIVTQNLTHYQYLVYYGRRKRFNMSKNTSVELGEEIAGFVGG